jgi:hypothetical protein
MAIKHGPNGVVSWCYLYLQEPGTIIWHRNRGWNWGCDCGKRDDVIHKKSVTKLHNNRAVCGNN